MTISQLPQRAARLSDDMQAHIVRLAIHQLTMSEIAKLTGVHRKTVRRVLDRTRAALRVNENLDAERAGAIAVYREVQRASWLAMARAEKLGRSPAMLLAEVRQTQQRIDILMGIAPSSPEDPAMQFQQFKSVVIDAIKTEAPESAPLIAQRLLQAAREDHNEPS